MTEITFIETYMESYPELMLAAAIALFVKQILCPYHHRENFPYDNPPDKLIGPFSLGELVQYIIQVISFPAIPLPILYFELQENLNTFLFMVLALVWWMAPRKLCRIIDGW